MSGSRRIRAAGTLLLLAAPAAALGSCAARSGPPGSAPLAIRGADVSFALQEEAAGNGVAAGSTRAGVEQILAAAGANYVRLRVWVSPPAGYSDAAAALTLARRAHAAKLKIFLAIHYSDFWADPTSQTPPAGWAGQDLAGLRVTVRRYTATLLRAFARQGTPVDLVQIGNEVNAGMLWPLGWVDPAGGGSWDAFAALLRAGIAGAREANPAGHRLLVALHLSGGADNPGCRRFLDRVRAAGVRGVDVLALSYYPFWDGPLAGLRANLDDLARRYAMPLVVAETAYPWRAQSGADDGLGDTSTLPEAAAYPPTPAGQAGYYRALRRVLLAVPGRRGAGLFAWAPDWLPGVDAVPGQRGAAGHLALFDSRGRALPALDVAFRPPRSRS